MELRHAKGIWGTVEGLSHTFHLLEKLGHSFKGFLGCFISSHCMAKGTHTLRTRKRAHAFLVSSVDSRGPYKAFPTRSLGHHPGIIKGYMILPVSGSLEREGIMKCDIASAAREE